MAGVCEICGKHVRFGNNVSHSKHRTPRTFKPNIQKTIVMVNNRPTRISACTRCIKTMAKPPR